jgi:ATP-dependent Clp protease ATP-binding subunit ClpX
MASDNFESLLPADRTASGIKAELDRYLVGQESAKQELSVLLSMHLSWWLSQDPRHKPPNGIVIGNTGVGKTHSLQTATRYLRLPSAIIDSTSLVKAGIVGMQVEDIMESLAEMANTILGERSDLTREYGDNLEFARRGIIFLDEFDKLRSMRDYDSSNNDAIQRRILKMAEGSRVAVGQNTTGDPTRFIDTTGMLFILGGTFAGLDDKRLRNQRPAAIRRGLTDSELVLSQDLINYGFLPELVARFQILIRYQDLTEDHFQQILQNEGISPIGIWDNHFSGMNKRLTVTPEAIDAITRLASKLALGARGVQQILFSLLAPAAYEFETSDQEEFTLTEDRVMKGWRLWPT